ncbi:MAG: hypothetical protein HY513_03570 [Candidatus Aenigmarchaeota archaeon]|nr:hypothetical protein [Candidatus Aenigmarchaeota archaeon]
MSYLARVSGCDIQAPVLGCSAGYKHFTAIDVPDIEVSANPRGPLTRYLHRLLERAIEEIGADEAERVNLLYDGDEKALTVDINFLEDPFHHEFSFVVEGIAKKKFVSRRGRIYADGKLLRRKTRVSDYFNGAKRLALTYVGSPDAELTERHDYDVLDEREKRFKEKYTTRVKTELEKAGLSPAVADEDLMYGRVLLTLSGFDETDIEPIDACNIADYLQQDDIECPCHFLEYDGERKVEEALAYLAEKGFVREAEGGYVLSAEHRRGQIRRQLEAGLVGLDYLADTNLTDAGILLALTDGPRHVLDIRECLERRGFETDGLAIRLTELARNGFLATDDLEEFSITSELIRTSGDPRQLQLPFQQRNEEYL